MSVWTAPESGNADLMSFNSQFLLINTPSLIKALKDSFDLFIAVICIIKIWTRIFKLTRSRSSWNGEVWILRSTNFAARWKCNSFKSKTNMQLGYKPTCNTCSKTASLSLKAPYTDFNSTLL